MGRWNAHPISLNSICLLLLSIVFATQAQSQPGATVHPSNNSQDLVWTGILRFNLESKQIQLPPVLNLAALTSSLTTLYQSEFEQFNITGKLVNVDASNTPDLKSSDIAYISCDDSAYPGELNAGDTIVNVITSQQPAAAILLYSTESNHCNYTADASVPLYRNIFTVLTPDSNLHIKDQINSGNSTGSTSILPDMSSVGSAPPSSSSSDGSPNNGSSSSGNLAGPSPTTAVAMIILYTITGIITALFLGIIITGAVRAHRHPERYGPRNAIGRPRQSRARGLARAMLETIPIVKFGDPYNPKTDATKGDVEMASGAEEEGPDEGRKSTSGHGALQSTGVVRDGANSEHTEDKVPQTISEAAGSSTPEQNPHESGNYVCPICTDDFVKDQDLRVLPCNHQFHPECIDPWLVNVSGTCPLCRIDLNPAHAEEDGDEGEQGDNAAQPLEHPNAEQTPEPTNARQHRGLSTYLHETLNVRRMRDASVEERIAALRRFRQANHDDHNAGETAEESQSRRSRLTSRLRERFRIRTRQHEDQSPASASES